MSGGAWSQATDKQEPRPCTGIVGVQIPLPRGCDVQGTFAVRGISTETPHRAEHGRFWLHTTRVLRKVNAADQARGTMRALFAERAKLSEASLWNRACPERGQGRGILLLPRQGMSRRLLLAADARRKEL